MVARLRWLSRSALYVCIILAVAFFLLVLPTILFKFPIVIEHGPYVSGPRRLWPSCLSYSEFITVRNEGLFSAPMSGWWIGDTEGIYHFPDRWLAPGEEIHVWSGSGTDNSANLYAGRQSSVWVVDVSYHLSYFYDWRTIIWGQVNCDPIF